MNEYTNSESGLVQQDASDSGKQPGVREYTQAEIDAIVQQRLARERAKYADYDALKEAAEKWKKHEEASKTEAERIAAEIARLKEERDLALQQSEKAKADADMRLLEAKVVAAAGQARAKVPTDAWKLVDQLALVGADEAVISAAVQSLIDAGRLPTLDKPVAPNLDGGAGSGHRLVKSSISLTPGQLAAARSAGMTPEQYIEAMTKMMSISEVK